MNNRTIKNTQHKNLFMQEYYTAEKSKSIANLEEILFHVTQSEKNGDAHELKNLCALLRHPLRSLNNLRLNMMVNEICFHEDDSLPPILTESLALLCRQLVDELRAN